VLAFVIAFLVGRMELKHGAGFDPNYVVDAAEEAMGSSGAKDKENLAKPKLFWFNVALTLAVILTLMFVDLPAFFVFMVGTAIALLVNYPGSKIQDSRIRAHSRGAILMASTLLSAGVLLGILQESGIMDAMAGTLVSVIPAALGPHIAIVIGILSAPLALVFCTDSYYYGVMPIVIGVAGAYGVSPVSVAVTMVVCRNLACFISPVVPATFLGCGLAGVEIKDHIKTSFFWVWADSLIMLAAGLILGIIPLFG
jgi:CitMHS family citrate-Mg2+:H+ or citrate-Ca2+:H+ symporter